MGEKLAMRPTGDGSVPVRQGIAPQGLDTSTKYKNIGSIDDVRGEIDDAHNDMRGFYLQDPDEVMRAVSGHLARLAEISKEIRRIEISARQWKAIRTNEVDPTMKDLMEQFQIHSRLQSVREMDFRVSGMNS
jgi:hypothetical protein